MNCCQIKCHKCCLSEFFTATKQKGSDSVFLLVAVLVEVEKMFFYRSHMSETAHCSLRGAQHCGAFLVYGHVSCANVSQRGHNTHEALY